MLLLPPHTPHAPVWKGKGKGKALGGSDLITRDEGSGGTDGIVIPLQLLSDSAYQS